MMKLTIFDEICDFWQNSRFVTIFTIFDELDEIWRNFWRNFWRFLAKFPILHEIPDFSRFLTKLENLIFFWKIWNLFFYYFIRNTLFLGVYFCWQNFRRFNPPQSTYQFEQGGGLTRMEAGGMSVFDKIHIMKYLQLKYTTLFLQKQKFLGKFCFYGCWCFPRAAGAQYSGYGVPVDNIDKSCREYTTCYNCIYNQQLIGQRCNENSAER